MVDSLQSFRKCLSSFISNLITWMWLREKWIEFEEKNISKIKNTNKTKRKYIQDSKCEWFDSLSSFRKCLPSFNSNLIIWMWFERKLNWVGRKKHIQNKKTQKKMKRKYCKDRVDEKLSCVWDVERGVWVVQESLLFH